jgi:hypothetical protein
MQVYQRIMSPYMPQGTSAQTNAPTPMYAPGELNCAFYDPDTGNTCLRVKLDSGATASSAVGVVAAGQLAFWKDQVAGIVTNDKNQCDIGPSGAINRVAGIFQLAVTAAPGVNGTDGLPVQYVCDLVIQSKSFNVQASGTLVAGANVLADTTASVSRAIAPAAVNTAPVSQILGTWNSTTITSNRAPATINIGTFIP